MFGNWNVGTEPWTLEVSMAMLIQLSTANQSRVHTMLGKN